MINFRKAWIYFLFSSLLIFTGLTIFIFVYIKPRYYNEIEQNYQHKSIELVNTVWSILNNYNQQVEDSVLSLHDAQQAAYKLITGLRYGNSLNDYYWIVGPDNTLISHPYSENFDEKNKAIVSSITIRMRNLCNEKGAGLLEYEWINRRNFNNTEPKTAYVRLFKPWNCIVGTGYYHRDLDEEVKQSYKRLITYSAILFLLFFLAYFMAFFIGRFLQKQTIQSLSTKQLQFENLFNQSPIPAEIFAPDGTRQAVNHAWKEYFVREKGIDMEYNILRNTHFRKYEFYNKITEAFKGKETFISITEIDTAAFGFDSGKKWMSLRLFPIFEGSEIKNVIIYYIDLTQLLKTDIELRKLSESIRQAPVSVVITDINGSIEYVNPRFTESTGFLAEEVLGKNPRILKSGLMPESIYTELWNTISEGKVWSNELLNKRKDGELIWEKTSISPILNEFGSTTHFVAIKEDITNQKKLEAELIAAKNKAEESDRLKSSFLANMSHEIRTPMNAIIGFSGFLVEEDLDKDTRREFCDHIRINGEVLLNLIDDILDISLIEAGQIRIRNVDTRITPILSELHRSYIDKNERYDRKPIHFELSVAPEVKEVVVKTDPNRLRQILNNLMSNALKYTNQGKICIGVNWRNTSELEFFVSDTGIGIPENEIDTVFKRFTHIDREYISLHKGTGLGLSITRELVNLLGGKITVKSKVAIGSEFRFTLPATKPLETEPEAMESLSDDNYYWPGKNILIVDDEETNIQYLQFILRHKGCYVYKAKTGEECLEVLHKFGNIDLVLMDIKLPGIDGYEIARRIKEIYPEIIIIAQTAYVFQDKEEEHSKPVFDKVIYKPLNKNKLLSELNGFFEL